MQNQQTIYFWNSKLKMYDLKVVEKHQCKFISYGTKGKKICLKCNQGLTSPRESVILCVY